jgi:hypothetical protein
MVAPEFGPTEETNAISVGRADDLRQSSRADYLGYGGDISDLCEGRHNTASLELVIAYLTTEVLGLAGTVNKTV